MESLGPKQVLRCVGGLEALKYFSSLPVPEGKEELHQYSLNRIRYEIAKGIGVKKNVIPAPKKGWHRQETCGKCGFGAGEAHFKYCPNCGTKYLDNPYTERLLRDSDINVEEILCNS